MKFLFSKPVARYNCATLRHAISRQKNLYFPLPQESMRTSFHYPESPYGRTYADVITKILGWIVSLSYGAPLACALRAQAAPLLDSNFFDIQNNQVVGKGYQPQPLPCEHTFLSCMAFGAYGSVNSKLSHLPSGHLSSCRSVTSRYLLDALTN